MIDSSAGLVPHVARDGQRLATRHLLAGEIGQEHVDLLMGLFDAVQVETSLVALETLLSPYGKMHSAMSCALR